MKMLRDVRSTAASSSSHGQNSPAQLLNPSPGNLESLPRLRDSAVTFPVAGSASSEAEHVSETDTHTHRGHIQGIDTVSHTDCHRQGMVNNTHKLGFKKT